MLFDAENYDEGKYKAKRDKYNEQKDKLKSIENTRNGFYITAGAFGVIGAVSFAF